MTENRKEIKTAESRVDRSTIEFERALSHLEEVAADGSEKLHQVAETARRPVRKLQEYAARARVLADHGRTRALQAYQRLQQNARPLLERATTDRRAQLGIGAGALLSGLLIATAVKRKSRAIEVDATAPDAAAGLSPPIRRYAWVTIIRSNRAA